MALVGAPDGFDSVLGELPRGARQAAPDEGPVDVLVFFAMQLADLGARFRDLALRIAPNGGLWVAWPKKASRVPTDLTENAIREVGLAAGLVDNKVCAIDERWSGLRFVYRLKDRPR